MSKFIRLLKSSKEKNLLRDEELQMMCTKCGKRPGIEPEGLCNHCRFADALTELTKKK